MSAQSEIPGVELVPHSLSHALRLYDAEIQKLRARLQRLAAMDAVSAAQILADADKAASYVNETVMGLRATHGKTPWFVRVFGQGEARASGHVTRHRALAARLLLDLGGGLGLTSDPRLYHAPIPESELHRP